ncbi:MAG: hypothetical protein ACRDJG_00530 [Actinomycetota bacterium]
MSSPSSRKITNEEHHFRVVVYALEGGTERVVMEGTGTGHHAAVGYFDGKKVVGKHSFGGHPRVLKFLAQVIADYPTG